MRILFSGLPYFGKKLVQELKKSDPKNSYVFCDTYYSLKDKIKFFLLLPFANRVVSFNGVSSNSRSLNLVSFWSKKIKMQWHGSDVSMVSVNKSLGKFTPKYIQRSQSFTDAPWLKEELNELGIQSEILHFKYVELVENKTPFSNNHVLTYFAEGKEKFYGLEILNALAKNFPDTMFHVIGSSGKNSESEKNVKFYGWVNQNKVKELMDSIPIYLRICEHDGYSLSVLEAMANGNYVIYNRPMPFTNYVSGLKDIEVVLKKIQQELNSNNFARNTLGHDWLRENHSREVVMSGFIKKILAD